jgi:hypothetical protein
MFMETTYTIEFMRPAEPTIAPIKQPSAFHVAYYCNLSPTLINSSTNAQRATFTLFQRSLAGSNLIVCEAVGKEGEGEP